MPQDNYGTTRGKLSSLTLSYAAGFLDADGCIGIAKVKNYHSVDYPPSYYLRVTVMGVHKGIIDWFETNFGGSVSSKMSRHGDSCYKPHHRVQWRWETTGNIALEALNQLVPYLFVKKEQAEIGIEFQTNKDRAWKGEYRGKQVPQELVIQREVCYQKMRKLKTAGETLESYRSRRD